MIQHIFVHTSLKNFSINPLCIDSFGAAIDITFIDKQNTTYLSMYNCNPLFIDSLGAITIYVRYKDEHEVHSWMHDW